jgi:hypothetical protein
MHPWFNRLHYIVIKLSSQWSQPAEFKASMILYPNIGAKCAHTTLAARSAGVLAVRKM